MPLTKRLITDVLAEQVREPNAMDELVRWAEDVQRPLSKIGMSIDDAFDSQVLRYMDLGKSTADVRRDAQIWRQRNWPHLWRGLRKVILAKAFQINTVYGAVMVRVLDDNGDEVFPLSLASLRVVTNAGVNAIVDGFQNTVEIENFNFHGIGTGTNAEAVGDTALQTELTTQYTVDNTRATGTRSEPSPNVYQTLGTNTVDATVAITEHGTLTQAATGGGTLLDRSVFSAINLNSGNQLETTYQFTINAGS